MKTQLKYLSILFLFSCSEPAALIETRIEGRTMGTTYHITYREENGLNLAPQIDSLLLRFNQVFSTYDTTSVISAFNQSEQGIHLDSNSLDWFSYLLQVSDSVYRISHGLFNPAIAPLVKYWGFYDDDVSVQPDSAAIDSILKWIYWPDVQLNGPIFQKKWKENQLDVNAIAPGYACDLIAGMLSEKGIEHYLIEIGGEVTARGTNHKNQIWTIGIQKPEATANEWVQSVRLHNEALATSGNYNKYKLVNGKKMGHTLNPNTGYPELSNLLSVTIIAHEAIYADALATACMVMGLEESRKFIEGLPNVKGLLIYSSEKGNLEYWKSEDF